MNSVTEISPALVEIPSGSAVCVKPLEIRRCFTSQTTDGCTYIAEFDDNQTAAVRHTVIHPDGRTYAW